MPAPTDYDLDFTFGQTFRNDSDFDFTGGQ